ncbi:MAG: squalene synthase HpnC [Proteobacteria bacterium]|nr:squalene synthase HpnC [Pseudomonadota bacterium]
MTRAADIETPSATKAVKVAAKRAGDENFPVGSRLIAARLRPHVAAFYAFARAADDIADDPNRSAPDKLARLDRVEAAVTGRDRDSPDLKKAHLMRKSLAATGLTDKHCVDILTAFKQDAVQRRYDDWSGLLAYCEYSANPVGRYLLDLHGESRRDYAASDALCTALQVINHLQDAQADYRGLDRVYVPLDWLRAEGLDVTALDEPRLDPALRRVFDKCLDGVDDLLVAARPLPRLLESHRLAMESAAILRLAESLSRRLRKDDPLAEPVRHSKLAFAGTALVGALGALGWRALPGRRRGDAHKNAPAGGPHG